MNAIPNLKFGEIWLANLNPTRGTEAGKTRPVLIVQAQALLDANHPSTLIIPLTTQLVHHARPLRLLIKKQDGLEKDSDLLIDQLRAIDNKRFAKGPLMQCSETFMKLVFESVSEVMGFADTLIEV